MNYIDVKIKKLDEKAITPTYGSEFSAGADLYACLDDDVEISPNETKFIKTGISVEIPEGFVLLVFARSGLSCKQGLAPANKVGVVDSDYRGEVVVVLHNHSTETRKISHGDRIAQMVIVPYFKANFKEVNSLSSTVRGEGGFGSTGKK